MITKKEKNPPIQISKNKQILIKQLKAERNSENAEKIAKDYIQMRKQLYNRIPPLEIKQLQEKLKEAKENKYHLFKGKTEISQNFDELTKNYQSVYEKFLARQPKVEENRQKIINNLAESHTILAILKVDAQLDSGLVSEYSGKLNEKDINKIIEKKLLMLEEGYIIDDFDDKFDITEECDKYLQNEERTLRKKLEIERREKDIV